MHLNAFDLNLLKALDALLAERSVTRAAQRLHVTQQAMSGSLKRLRGHFDDALLIRVGGRLEPTPLGAALRGPVREMMLQIAKTVETKPTFDPALAQRRFPISMSDYATITILPHFMAEVAVKAPGIVFDFQLIDNSVFRDLESGLLDFCLWPREWRQQQPGQPTTVRAQTLFADDFVCVVDRDNPRVGDRLSLDEYLAMPHNVVRFGDDIRSIVEEGWTVAGIRPHVAATTTSFASLVFMIPGTPLIATAQRRLAHKLALMLPVRLIDCPAPIPSLQEEVTWHARNDLDPAHRFVREAFAAAAQAMERSQPVIVPAIRFNG